MSPDTRCPYCANTFSGLRATCPFCRRQLPQHLRAQAAAAREQERRRKEAERAQAALARAQQAQEREAKRQYQGAREAEAIAMTEAVETQIQTLSALLHQTLSIDDAITFDDLKDRAAIPDFDGGKLAVEEPAPVGRTVDYTPPSEPSGLHKLIPGWRKKHETAVAQARTEHEEEVAKAEREHADASREHAEREAQRRSDLDAARVKHDEAAAALEVERAVQHQSIDNFEQLFLQGDQEAIAKYFSLVLERSPYPEPLKLSFRLAFVPESRQLVVEKELAPLDAVPTVRSFRYVKAKDEIVASARPVAERRSLFATMVGQIVLRTLHELFEADTPHHLETLVLNAFVDTVDPRTGKPIRPYLVTLRTSRHQFSQLDLARVEPLACLKALNAGVSKSPAELVPIRPVLDFDMVDPRFVQEADVLSTLDQRPNLMELTPGEFEAVDHQLVREDGPRDAHDPTFARRRSRLRRVRPSPDLWRQGRDPGEALQGHGWC
jgi:restriction system protein